MIFSQKGNATFVALGITSVLLVSAAGAGAIVTSSLKESPKIVNSGKALFAAEGAIESALFEASETGIGYTLEHETAPVAGDPGYIEMSNINNTKSQWETKAMAEIERDRTDVTMTEEVRNTVYLPSRKAEPENIDDETKNKILKQNWKKVRFGQKYSFDLFSKTTKRYKVPMGGGYIGTCANCDDTKSILTKDDGNILKNVFLDIFIPNIQGLAGETGAGTESVDATTALSNFNNSITESNILGSNELQNSIGGLKTTVDSEVKTWFETQDEILQLMASNPSHSIIETIEDVNSDAHTKINTAIKNKIINKALTELSKEITDVRSIMRDSSKTKEQMISELTSIKDSLTLASPFDDSSFITAIQSAIGVNDFDDIRSNFLEVEHIDHITSDFYGKIKITNPAGGGISVLDNNNTITIITPTLGVKTFDCMAPQTSISMTGSSAEILCTHNKLSVQNQIVMFFNRESDVNTLLHSHVSNNATGNEIATKVEEIIKGAIDTAISQITTTQEASEIDSGDISDAPLFSWAIQSKTENSGDIKYIGVGSHNKCSGDRSTLCLGDAISISDSDYVNPDSVYGQTIISKKVTDYGLWLRIYNPQGMISARSYEKSERAFPATLTQYINRADQLDYTDAEGGLFFSNVDLQEPKMNIHLGKKQEWITLDGGGATTKKRNAYIRFGFEYGSPPSQTILEDFPVPNEVVRIEATGEADGYTQKIEVNVKPQEVAPMFDYAVFQQ